MHSVFQAICRGYPHRLPVWVWEPLHQPHHFPWIPRLPLSMVESWMERSVRLPRSPHHCLQCQRWMTLTCIKVRHASRSFRSLVPTRYSTVFSSICVVYDPTSPGLVSLLNAWYTSQLRATHSNTQAEWCICGTQLVKLVILCAYSVRKTGLSRCSPRCGRIITICKKACCNSTVFDAPFSCRNYTAHSFSAIPCCSLDFFNRFN